MRTSDVQWYWTSHVTLTVRSISDADGQRIETTLPVPAWNPDEPYLMGFFLVGAYQEILGDMHNLFGDTHSVVVNATAEKEH